MVTNNTSYTQGNEKSACVEQQKQKKRYRTKKNVKRKTDTLPKKIPIISIDPYMEALSFPTKGYKGCAAHLKLKNGSTQIPELNTLRFLNGVMLKKFGEDYDTLMRLAENPEHFFSQDVTIYMPEYIKAIGMSTNINESNIRRKVEKIQKYTELMGVVKENEYGFPTEKDYPVISSLDYDESDNTLSFTSPYMIIIIGRVFEARLRRDRWGNPQRNKSGGWGLKAGYSWRLNSEILKERNERAIEVVSIIVTLIDRAGSHTPNISFRTIIDRCEMLKRDLDSALDKSRNSILKKVFSKAWELLVLKTDLLDSYRNIKIPKTIPTMETLDHVIEFTHDGKIKGVIKAS